VKKKDLWVFVSFGDGQSATYDLAEFGMDGAGQELDDLAQLHKGIEIFETIKNPPHKCEKHSPTTSGGSKGGK